MIELLKNMPGFNIKYGLEMLAQHLFKETGHSFDKYEARFFFQNRVAEFLVFHPGKRGLKGTTWPPQYDHDGKPMKSQLGVEQLPPHSHLYALQIPGDAIDMIKDLILDYAPEAAKLQIDFVTIDIDRNAAEYPYKLYYQKDGEKVIKKGIAK